MANKPTTCIVGAGISGLTAGKAFADWGLPYTCFESSDDIGGNWYFRNPNGASSAYQSLHIDTSRDGVSFRDMPMGPDEFPDYPHHTQILAYLHRYADAFSLRDQIRFETPVEHAERKDGGGWRITLEDGSIEEFDFLVVGNGHHWDPRYPDFPGGFDGETIHGHHYIGPDDPLGLYDKRVLVVGIGNTAVDITSELSRKGVAEKVFISTRSGAWVVPKYFLGRPLDTLVKVNPRLPVKLQRILARPIPRLASGRMEDFGLPHPNHRFMEAHPTVSSELLLRLGSGDAVAKPNVSELIGDRVRFEDGSVERIDAIIYATGYKVSFPFFDPEFLSAPENRLPLYKRIFKPGIDDLALIGFAQAIPTLFPFVELQSKLVARYAGGEYALPPIPEMEETIRRDEALHTADFSDRPRHTMEIEWYSYEHDIWHREIPAGRKRAARGMAAELAPRAAAVEAAAA
ncbi:MAG TPA: NAD(P)-binding domain-containing protein [Solirubrobacterales bacterium]|nr:NAD(P)-binding domain-containing protein [Solirubrobacterales bacterium]